MDLRAWNGEAKMPKFRKLTFKIRDFTPHTLPMARLSEYLAEYARLLGSEESVHFVRVGEGSAALISEIEEPFYASVRRRAMDASRGVGPQDAVKAFQQIDAKLRRDATAATLQSDTEKKILMFPGVTATPKETFGPFNQPGTVEGTLIKIGGRDNTIPVHIEDSAGGTFNCNATREMARKLAPYLFGNPIRLHGTGRYVRHADGTWEMTGFNIEYYEELNNDPLPVVIERLRAIPGSEWDEILDPLADLEHIRQGKAN
jgi:hypothetical protein